MTIPQKYKQAVLESVGAPLATEAEWHCLV
jgi:hypothetical protein